MSDLLIGLIRAYRYVVSPWLGSNCRFAPSCSEYALSGIAKYGAIKGCWLALWRICRCHPWCEGGYDPLP
jgi:uncharacterized protein